MENLEKVKKPSKELVEDLDKLYDLEIELVGAINNLLAHAQTAGAKYAPW